MKIVKKLWNKLMSNQLYLLRDYFTAENMTNQLRPRDGKVVMVYEKVKAAIVDINYRTGNKYDFKLLVDGFEYEIRGINEYTAEKYFKLQGIFGITVYRFANGRMIYKEPKDGQYINQEVVDKFRGSERLIRDRSDVDRYTFWLDLLYLQMRASYMVFLSAVTVFLALFILNMLGYSKISTVAFMATIYSNLLILAIFLNRLTNYVYWNEFINRIGYYPRNIELIERR